MASAHATGGMTGGMIEGTIEETIEGTTDLVSKTEMQVDTDRAQHHPQEATAGTGNARDLATVETGTAHPNVRDTATGATTEIVKEAAQETATEAMVVIAIAIGAMGEIAREAQTGAPKTREKSHVQDEQTETRRIPDLAEKL